MSSESSLFSQEARSLRPGQYRHFKGGEYTVVGVAHHSETQEELVIYRADYIEGGLLARPLEMFIGRVAVDGEDKPRFTYLG